MDHSEHAQHSKGGRMDELEKRLKDLEDRLDASERDRAFIKDELIRTISDALSSVAGILQTASTKLRTFLKEGSNHNPA